MVKAEQDLLERLDKARIQLSSNRAIIEEIHSEYNDLDAGEENTVPADIEDEEILLSDLCFSLEDIFGSIDSLEDDIEELVKVRRKKLRIAHESSS